MGQRYSCGSLRDTVATLHCAIADGESEAAHQLLLALRHRSGCTKEQLYLSYRGETAFGVEVRYSQTALALAIQFRQWATFRNLLQCGLQSAAAQQRMLVPTRSGQCSTRDFGSALELFVWALTQATYFPPYLSEAEVLDLLGAVLRGGAAPDSLPPPLLRHLGQSAIMDIIGAEFLDVETATVLQRSALSVLRSLVQHGLSPQLTARAVGGQASLYQLLLCFLSDATLARRFRAQRKLRVALCLLLNAYCGTGVQLPTVTRSGLASSRSRNTPLFWYYYSKIARRHTVDKEDVGRVLMAHGRMLEACSRQPARLSLLARHRVRAAVAAGGVGDFAERIGALPLRRRLKQQLLFLDEEALEPEFAGLLSIRADA